MRIRNLILILFLSSAFLFIPAVRPSISYTVFPFQENSIILSVQTTSIKVTSNVAGNIQMNVSLMNTKINDKVTVWSGLFISEKVIDLTSSGRGNYLIVIISQQISQIKIDELGIPITTFAYLLGSFMLFIIFELKRYFSSPMIY